MRNGTDGPASPLDPGRCSKDGMRAALLPLGYPREGGGAPADPSNSAILPPCLLALGRFVVLRLSFL